MHVPNGIVEWNWRIYVNDDDWNSGLLLTCVELQSRSLLPFASF